MTESGGLVTSSSSTALKLALSSGRSDSFSSSAKVAADVTLFPSILGGLPDPSEDESCVLLSSAADTLTKAMDRGRSIPSSLMSDEGAAD